MSVPATKLHGYPAENDACDGFPAVDNRVVHFQFTTCTYRCRFIGGDEQFVANQ